MLTRSYSCKSQSSMSLKRSLTQSLSSNRCLLTPLRWSLLRLVFSLKKKSMRKQDRSFRMLWTWRGINVISLTTLPYAITSLSNWRLLSNTLPISLRKEWESTQNLVLDQTLRVSRSKVLETPRLLRKLHSSKHSTWRQPLSSRWKTSLLLEKPS